MNIICHTLEEIKEVIKQFVRSGDDTSISCNISGIDESGAHYTQNVKAISSDSSPRSLLINGLDVIKRRMEIKEKVKGHDTNLRIFDDNVHFSVDSLITKRLGGVRNGLRVRWTIRDGIYEFDPYSNKLYKVED